MKQLFILLLLFGLFTNVQGQWLQPIPILTTGLPAKSLSGRSVSISADGKTAIVGAPGEYTAARGSATIFNRVGNDWLQDATFTGGFVTDSANFGYSVDLSADGSTAIVGAFQDSSGKGSAWIFVRSNGVWTGQGTRLPIPDHNYWEKGCSVGLSADGNTAIVGSNGLGAWIFSRSGTGNIWTFQSPKLFSNSASDDSEQGYSVSISGDGNTAMVGDIEDNVVRVYYRNGNIWESGQEIENVLSGTLMGTSISLSQDGNTASIGVIGIGVFSTNTYVCKKNGENWGLTIFTITDTMERDIWGDQVSISADGNTAVFAGGPDDDEEGVSAWIYDFKEDDWNLTQKITANEQNSQNPSESIVISGDGNTILMGGPGDNSNYGKAWIFYKSSSTAIRPNSSTADVPNIYPNPTHDKLTIKLTKTLAKSTMRIFDANNRVVYEKNIDGQSQITQQDLSHLAKGIYTLFIESNNGQFRTKIIKY